MKARVSVKRDPRRSGTLRPTARSTRKPGASRVTMTMTIPLTAMEWTQKRSKPTATAMTGTRGAKKLRLALAPLMRTKTKMMKIHSIAMEWTPKRSKSTATSLETGTRGAKKLRLALVLPMGTIHSIATDLTQKRSKTTALIHYQMTRAGAKLQELLEKVALLRKKKTGPALKKKTGPALRKRRKKTAKNQISTKSGQNLDATTIQKMSSVPGSWLAMAPTGRVKTANTEPCLTQNEIIYWSPQITASPWASAFYELLQPIFFLCTLINIHVLSK